MSVVPLFYPNSMLRGGRDEPPSSTLRPGEDVITTRFQTVRVRVGGKNDPSNTHQKRKMGNKRNRK